MLAAVWLAQGYDSEELRELAGLMRQDGRQEGRLLLPGVLASLGWPPRDQDDARQRPPWLEEDDTREQLPWLGYWSRITWARDEMDRLLAPYAAAQVVIEVADDEPDLWVPVRADRLMSLLRRPGGSAACLPASRYDRRFSRKPGCVANCAGSQASRLAAGRLRRQGSMLQARQALGPARTQVTEEHGATMTLRTATEFAAMLITGDPQTVQPPRLARLSVRERELVTLVARGQAGARIAG